MRLMSRNVSGSFRLWYVSRGLTRRHVDLRNKLIAIYKSSSSKKGQLHVHVTCAIVSIIDRPIQGTRRLTKYLQDLDRMTNVIVRGESLKCSLLIRWLTAHSPSQSERWSPKLTSWRAHFYDSYHRPMLTRYVYHIGFYLSAEPFMYFI